MKPPLLTSTLKAGLTVSLALHVVAAVGVMKFRHSPAFVPPDQHVTITLFSDVEHLVEPESASEPAPLEPSPPPEIPAPAPNPTPAASAPVSAPAPLPVVPTSPTPAPTAAPAPTVLLDSTNQLALAVPVPAPVRTGGGGATPALEPAVVARTTSPGVRALPLYQKNPEPPYPTAARRRRQEGLVLLRVTVSTVGRATRVEVKQSSSFPLLDEAAVRAVREWEFAPARLDSQAVESEIEVPVRFKLIN